MINYQMNVEELEYTFRDYFNMSRDDLIRRLISRMNLRLYDYGADEIISHYSVRNKRHLIYRLILLDEDEEEVSELMERRRNFIDYMEEEWNSEEEEEEEDEEEEWEDEEREDSGFEDSDDDEEEEDLFL